MEHSKGFGSAKVTTESFNSDDIDLFEPVITENGVVSGRTITFRPISENTNGPFQFNLMPQGPDQYLQLNSIKLGGTVQILNGDAALAAADDYSITNGIMQLSNAGIPGTNANRISDAKALATYVHYKMKWNNLTIHPGIRYENIQLSRTNYGNNDVERTGTDLALRENQVDVFIPGIGLNYNFENISVFGGVHKGFSPPSNQPGEKPEESLNYELGTRFSYAGITGEIVGFFNDYSNLLGSDLAATGGTGTLDQFNAGEVNVGGLEVLLNYDFLPNATDFALPITLGYTYTDTAFQSSFGSENDIWGEVRVGDEMPYIAKHQFNGTFSLEHDRYEINLSARYNGEFRTQAGSGPIPDDERVDANFIFDLSGKYRFGKHIAITTQIINLFDETYAVARVPAGLRPGHPFGIYGGIELRY